MLHKAGSLQRMTFLCVHVGQIKSAGRRLCVSVTVVCFLIFLSCRSINKEQFQRKKNDTLDPELYVPFFTHELNIISYHLCDAEIFYAFCLDCIMILDIWDVFICMNYLEINMIVWSNSHFWMIDIWLATLWLPKRIEQGISVMHDTLPY